LHTYKIPYQSSLETKLITFIQKPLKTSFSSINQLINPLKFQTLPIKQ
jgi:hypothetical protein